MVLLVAFLLTGVCAHAQVQTEFDAQPFTRMLTVHISGLEAGQEYVFLVFPEGEDKENPDLADLLLIDQLTASKSGELTVGIQNAKPCFVMLGGRFDGEISPLLLGSYGGGNVLNAPAGLREIQEEAFAGGAFDYVYIAGNTHTIGPRAFMNCRNLREIMIPGSVVSIGADAFAGCEQLVIVCSENSAAHRYAVENNIDYRFDQ